MQTIRHYSGQLFLDQQPTIERTIKDWLETIELDRWHVAYDAPRLEPIECRSRDGFIRASHNYGGFDLEYFSQVDVCVGGGTGPNLAEIDRQEKQAYKEAIKWFKEQKFEGLENLTDDEITYSNLHELGYPKLAEQLDEVQNEWMNSPVWWGIRAMYEGKDSAGIHTLMLYASGNVCEYYGAHGQGSQSFGEWTIRFKTASGLRRQLARLKNKIESAF